MHMHTYIRNFACIHTCRHVHPSGMVAARPRRAWECTDTYVHVTMHALCTCTCKHAGVVAARPRRAREREHSAWQPNAVDRRGAQEVGCAGRPPPHTHAYAHAYRMIYACICTCMWGWMHVHMHIHVHMHMYTCRSRSNGSSPRAPLSSPSRPTRRI